MLSFFRRFTKSRFGLIIVFLVLGVIALAFAASDVTGLRTSAMVGGHGNVIATVGSTQITDAELKERVDLMVRNLRNRGQPFTIEQFLAQGGFEAALNQTINDLAVEEFAKRGGMYASKALIDGELASNPAFQGVDGKFDQKTFDSILSQQRISPQLLRQDMMRERYSSWLLIPGGTASRVPTGVLAPYASLLLERRQGIGTLIRSIDMDPGADPDDKTLTTYYRSHLARYTVPQRRVLRYAIVHPDQFKARSAATDAEVAAAFAKTGPRYAAKEKRSVRQLVLLDQATANSVAAQVKGGKSIDEVAKGMGLSASNFAAVEKPDLARQTAPAIADAAFAAAEGSVAGPIRSPLGWHVLRVDKIEKIAAKSLAEAHDELAAEITDRKITTALVTVRQQLDDAAGDGATFDELMKAGGLQPSATPALLANGTNPDDPAFKLDPALAPVMRAGFTIEPEDRDPQLVSAGQDGSFAVVAVQQVVPATARPLASIRKQVNSDYLLDQAQAKARASAAKVVADLNKGVPMQQALANAGVKPGAKIVPFDLKRSDLQAQQQVQPQVAMAFSMAPKRAKLLEAPNRSGYFIVYLEAIETHDASGDPAMMEQVRGAIAPQIAPELREQFLEAIRRDVVVKRNEDVIARLKASYASSNSGG